MQKTKERGLTMADDNNLDLLDLEDEAELDELPSADPFAGQARPKRPWLLLGAAVLVIALAAYITAKVVGGADKNSFDIDLGVPEKPVAAATAADSDSAGAEPLVVGGEDSAEPAQVSASAPVRHLEDRKPVKFNPDAASVAPKPRPAAKPVAQKHKAAVAKKPTPSVGGSNYYVQFGSYSTRALAETAQRKITAGHPSLLGGRQFVILAAVLPNGTTTYRLRVGFSTVQEADGFCRNAKSDGLDCYVAR